jgi:hypothetical protein
MSSYDQAMTVLAAFGIIMAIVGLFLASEVDKLERERRERDAARHSAE